LNVDDTFVARAVPDSTTRVPTDTYVTDQENVIHDGRHRPTLRHLLPYQTSPFRSTCCRDRTTMRSPFHRRPDHS